MYEQTSHVTLCIQSWLCLLQIELMSRKNAKSQLRLDQLYFSPCEINDGKVDKEPEGEGEGRVKKEIRKSLLKPDS